MTVQLLDKDAHADLVKDDGTKTSFNFTSHSSNESNNSEITEIRFHNIEPTPFQTNSTELLMKRPEIEARGNVIFESLFRGQDGFDVSKGIEGIEGIPLELIGANVDMNLGYVDSYDISSKNKHATNYLTYIRNLQFIQPSKNIVDKTELRIPGDISEQAKQEGIHVPLESGISFEHKHYSSNGYFYSSITNIIPNMAKVDSRIWKY